MTSPRDTPAFDELADDQDQLGWDRERDGLMADAATDDEPATEAYIPEES